MQTHHRTWAGGLLPLLLALLVGCAPPGHIRHADKMEALGAMLGVSADEAEARLNQNQARQRQAAQQAALARQQAEAQRLAQQQAWQSRHLRPPAEQPPAGSGSQSPPLTPPAARDRPSASPGALCPNLQKIAGHDHSGPGSPVCVE